MTNIYQIIAYTKNGEVNVKDTKKNIFLNIKIIVITVIFMIISLISIYSSQKLLSSNYNNLYIKQLIWYIIGFIFIIIIYKSKNKFLYDHSNILYVIGNILLILVLFFGTESNGAKCWFKIPGIGSFQPSEFVKIFIILNLANMLNKYNNEKKKKNIKNEFKIIFKSLIIVLIPSFLAFLEPDTGIIFIFFSILLIILFSSGIRFRWFACFFIITGILLSLFLILFFNYEDLFIDIFGTSFFYRMDRLLDWKNGSGMQLTNALAATGSAGLFGYGFNNTPIYFPEPQTDFIFSVFASNFGFILTLILLLLILYFDMQIIKSAMNANGKYKLIICGILSTLLFQQIQNIGMNIGILPITGITLPFISYGGSSLVSYMIMIGIVLNINRINNLKN